MTERGLPIVDGAPACPFVAFEDDRDERATSPDHRHRCYAEARPAPRALAHQEAYCLSSAFPVCPTFQDWARREAARSRADGPRTPGDSAELLAADQPQRNPPRNWSAPPPWAAGRGPADDDEALEGQSGRGLSGSYADRVASGAAAAELGAAAASEIDAGAAAASAAAGLPSAPPPDPWASPPAPPSPPPVDHAVDARMADSRPVDPRSADPRAAADEHGAPSGPRHERRRDSAAPEWERARPLEVYPTLRARRLPDLSVPPLLVAVVALALAAAVLFALPGLLGFGGPGGAVASPTPTVAPSVEATVLPTAVPEPTPVIYLVQSGDTMSKIAKKFHVALDDLIAANAENIPNPDVLKIGDQVIIPVAQPSGAPAASEAPASP